MTQRPAMRCRSSSSASRADSPRKRSVSTSLWPIVFPSITPETESDSSTSVEMSASEPCFTRVISRRCAPTRRVSRTNTGSRAKATSESFQSRNSIANAVAMTVVTVRDDGRRRRRDDALHAADVVRDARLHLARARAREEGEREALQVRVHGRAQVVHDVLADAVGEPGLADADDAGQDRDGDHARDQEVELPGVDLLALREDVVEQLAQQERRDRRDRRGARDQGRAGSRGSCDRAGRARGCGACWRGGQQDLRGVLRPGRRRG